MIELTRFELIMAIFGVMVMAMGSFVAILRWIYNRGSSNRALVDSVARNTEATDKLTGAVDILSTAVSDRILSLETRTTRLEYDMIRYNGKD